MSNRCYTLIGQTPVAAELEEWAIWFEDIDNRRVALWSFGPLRVSTIFMGIDHNFFSDGPPLLFETMAFLWSSELWQDRCATWAEAEAMQRRGITCVHRLWRHPLFLANAAREALLHWMDRWDRRFLWRYGKTRTWELEY